MSTFEESPAPVPPPPPEAPEPAAPSQGPPAARSAATRTWLVVVATALLAGALSWLVGEAAYDYFQPSEEAARQQYDFSALNREMAVAGGRNGAVAFGALGGLLGLAMGLVGGLARRSAHGALGAGLAGLVLGVAAGALPAFVLVPWHVQNRNNDPASLNLLTPLLVHIGLWCLLGLTAGLAYGLGRYGLERTALLKAALGGLIGAVVGAVVYEMIGAVAFPLSRTNEPISVTAATRLLARLCVAGFVAAGVLFALRPAEPRGVTERASGAPLPTG